MVAWIPVKWYIRGMRSLRMKRVQAPLALIVATVFFAGQAFACCMANRELVAFLSSAFESAPALAAHSCCPKTEAAPEKSPADCASKACCIQDTGHKPPQLVSAAAEIPDLSGPTQAVLPLPPASVLPAPPPARAAADTGPPILLRSVRILV